MTKSAFEKQVKRRISAREQDFFAVSPPGLTRLCADTLHGLGMDAQKMKPEKGGVEFTCKPDLCMDLHLKTGCASRILMRIAQFKADNFHKFENRMNRIEWPLFLPKGCAPEFKVSTKKSALYHSDALAGRSQHIIDGHLSAAPADPLRAPSPQTVYIRTVDNLFTVSLDCSGAPLYKRGIKKTVTPAPLRETLAFAMLNWAGLRKEDVVIDPMCGSGTFSLEATFIKKNIAPGLFRSYAFEAWPGFSSRTFAWLKKQAYENITPDSGGSIYAFDIDEIAVAALNENSAHPMIHGTIHAAVSNFFDLDANMVKSRSKGVIMLNPPYGKRLGASEDTASFYHEIGKKLKSDFSGWRLGIILPDQNIYRALGIKLNLNPIFHGGLDLFAGIGQI